ncbi:thiol-specific monooxygenase [Colletotrichum liriopes]|uniref:Thiol-specific monooxygenase n=1 Tax=Colletotrichum liriopes TaxID=708192 RepID=A0AA37LVM3_9PEZI|nr:thiol-specific monooxygenase [Colletotrichum liriopes]
MAAKIRRVAVIGAGPSGAIATDALVKEQAFDSVRIFDRRAEPGGTCIPSLQALLDGNADAPVSIPAKLPAHTPKSEAINSHQIRFSDTAQHEHLHTNITPEIMSFTTEPFPETLTDRIREKYGDDAPSIREWVEHIFVRNGHEKLLELNTTVELAEKKGDEWVLTLRKDLPGKNQWWQETFDALIVATGHYNIPWIPNIEGITEYDKRFPGRIVHSKHFRGSDKYKGKKQIVNFCPKSGAITFADGTVVRDVDHVILGTGYTFSFPFLPEVQKRVLQADRRLPGVYYHTWNIEDSTLAFLGMCGGGFTFRLFEWQAVAVARRLAGRGNPLPSKEEQKEWERKRVAEFGGGKNYYTIAPFYKEVFEHFRSIAGDPAPGTTGRVLPPFDDGLLDIWATMGSAKAKSWEDSKKRAEAEVENQLIRPRL